MKYNKQISVVLGSYNRFEFLKFAINSVRQDLDGFDYEIIVIDGGSSDGSMTWLLDQKDIITIIQHNRGDWNGKKIKRRSWGYFMNLGFKCAQGKYTCMLSDDCLVVPGAIKNGYHYFEQQLASGKNVGALAFYWRDWSVQQKYHVMCTLGNKMYVNHGMYLTKALAEVNFAEEDLYFFYYADGDLCLKMWGKGYECIDCPNSFVEHYPHANLAVRKTNHDQFSSDLKNYVKKWDGIFYDLRLNNMGMLIEKEFDDKSITGSLFESLHQQVAASNPAILKPKPFYLKVAKRCNILFDAGVRRVKLIFKDL